MGLKTELIAEASSKIADSAFSVAGDIWNLPDMVEHVAAREQKHGNETDRGPEVAVLQDRHNVRSCDGDESNCA